MHTFECSIHMQQSFTVREHLLDRTAPLVLLTETWLKPYKSAVVNKLTPPGHSYLGKCRPVKGGGGVGLIFKSDYKFKKIAHHHHLCDPFWMSLPFT